jgi:DNA invertase Pin-like site-specific DNA recombinase
VVYDAIRTEQTEAFMRDSQRNVEPIPVAQYLRMSTEHQQYSTINQSLAILQYAAKQNMEIVRTYADHGKSGVGIVGRDGLKSLLRDAETNPDFQAVLVYDVSRWGRFQNPDESASYEYRLHTIGIPIHYCAEPFENDGSLASAIIKTVKRGMAGEYSRELSNKVWAGQKHIVELGFHVGGIAGYGLRRQLIGEDGQPKQILQMGQRKSLQTEHVILVPGPANEIKVIKRIYSMYIDEGLTEEEIVERLNSRNVPCLNGRPWGHWTVHTILTNDKYIGASVYNRQSCKLQMRTVNNPRQEWVVRHEAFSPVVSKERFEQVKAIRLRRVGEIPASVLLSSLKRLIEQNNAGDVLSAHLPKTLRLVTRGLQASRFSARITRCADRKKDRD